MWLSSPEMSVGHLLTFLTKLPLLGAASGGKLAYLSALLEATVVGYLEEVCAYHVIDMPYTVTMCSIACD